MSKRSMGVVLTIGLGLANPQAWAAGGPTDPLVSAFLSNETVVASAPVSDYGFGGETPTVYMTYGTRVYAQDAQSGARKWASAPFPATLQGGVQPVRLADGSRAIFIANKGIVRRLSAESGAVIWTRSLQRLSSSGVPTCVDDDVIAAPTVVLQEFANTQYLEMGNNDIVIVGTRYGCGTNTLNRFYALNAATGTAVWSFNTQGAWQVGFSSRAPSLDYDSNVAYFGTDIPSPTSYQNSLWAMSLLTGERIWSVNTGNGIRTLVRPIGGIIYTAGYNGRVTAHNQTTGALLRAFQLTTTSGAPTTITSDMWVEGRGGGFQGWMLARTGDGRLHGMRELATGIQDVWQSNFGASVSTMPVLDPRAGIGYVGLSSGSLVQFSVSSGIVQSSSLLPGNATVYEPGVTAEDASSALGFNRLSVISAGYWRNYAVPWPATSGGQGRAGSSSASGAAPLGGGGYCVVDEDCRVEGSKDCVIVGCVDGYCVEDTTKTEGDPCTVDFKGTGGGMGCATGVCSGGMCDVRDSTACGCVVPNQPAACGGSKTCCGETSGGCVDFDTDVNHCGGCGNECADGQQCVNGMCLSALCSVPLDEAGLVQLVGANDLSFDQIDHTCHLYTSFWTSSDKGGIYHVQDDGTTVDQWDHPDGFAEEAVIVSKDGVLSFGSSSLVKPSFHWHDQPGNTDTSYAYDSPLDASYRNVRVAFDTKVYTGAGSTQARVYVANESDIGAVSYYDLELASGAWNVVSGPTSLFHTPDGMSVSAMTYSVDKESGDGQVVVGYGDLDVDGHSPTLYGYCDSVTNNSVACARSTFTIDLTKENLLDGPTRVITLAAHRSYGDLGMVLFVHGSTEGGDIGFLPVNVRIDDLTVRPALFAQRDFNLVENAAVDMDYTTVAYAGSMLWAMRYPSLVPDVLPQFRTLPQRP